MIIVLVDIYIYRTGRYIYIYKYIYIYIYIYILYSYKNSKMDAFFCRFCRPTTFVSDNAMTSNGNCMNISTIAIIMIYSECPELPNIRS